jgi:hypothetical protein
LNGVFAIVVIPVSAVNWKQPKRQSEKEKKNGCKKRIIKQRLENIKT